MKELLEQSIKAALLSGDTNKATALRFIKNALDLAEKEKTEALTEEESMSVLRKEVKKREEAASLFEKGGNLASAEKERSEAAMIREYLPPEVSEEDIRSKIQEIIAEKNIPKEISSMGAVIGAVSSALGSGADRAVIARIASEVLKG